MRNCQPVHAAAFGAQPFRDGGHPALGARNHHRRRTVDRGDTDGFAEQRPHLVLGGLQREHGSARGQRLHEPAAGDHQDRSVLQGEAAGDVGGGQLADRVAHHEIGTYTPGVQ